MQTQTGKERQKICMRVCLCVIFGGCTFEKSREMHLECGACKQMFFTACIKFSNLCVCVCERWPPEMNINQRGENTFLMICMPALFVLAPAMRCLIKNDDSYESNYHQKPSFDYRAAALKLVSISIIRWMGLYFRAAVIISLSLRA